MTTEQEPELTYEEAREQLVEVVRALEGGGTSLAESLALWERGETGALLVVGDAEDSEVRDLAASLVLRGE